jgi:predicted amidohydrolase
VGGSAVYDRDGRIIVEANRSGEEEILYYDLPATSPPAAGSGR